MCQWSALIWALTGGCDSVPVADSRFWKGQIDGGALPPGDGSGGASVVPPGSGGAGPFGSGGDTGSGGGTGAGASDGSADPIDAGASGGTHVSGGSGGIAAGSGGRAGTGGGAGGNRGSGGAAATGGAAPVATGGNGVAGPGTLLVAVTTKSLGGRYEPSNVGAIWIADTNTKFVKTLYVWGSQRRKELRTWIAATTAAGSPSNLVDAVTSATKSGHGVRSGMWNGTNISKALVPDGSYKVCYELEDGKSQSTCVDFAKSRQGQTWTPADSGCFTSQSLAYTP